MIFVDSSVILNLIFDTQMTALAKRVLELDEPKITSDTVVDETYLVVLKKILVPENRSTKSLRRLLKKDLAAREKAGELLALVLGSISAMGIVIVTDARWDTVGELVSSYGLLPTTRGYSPPLLNTTAISWRLSTRTSGTSI